MVDESDYSFEDGKNSVKGEAYLQRFFVFVPFLAECIDKEGSTEAESRCNERDHGKTCIQVISFVGKTAHEDQNEK